MLLILGSSSSKVPICTKLDSSMVSNYYVFSGCIVSGCVVSMFEFSGWDTFNSSRGKPCIL